MDEKLSSEIQDALSALESQLEDMSELSALNDRLSSANEGLSSAAGTLTQSAEKLPVVLEDFRGLAIRLDKLATILEGSELSILVSKVEEIGSRLDAQKQDISQEIETFRTGSADLLASKISELETQLSDVSSALSSLIEGNSKLSHENVDLRKALTDVIEQQARGLRNIAIGGILFIVITVVTSAWIL